MLTLKELKNMVTGCEERKRVPGAEDLKKESEILLKEVMGTGASISVYKNGYVLYEAESGKTVFSLKDCGEYSYESVTENSQIVKYEIFDNEAWYIRLVLEGEDRLEENGSRKHNKHTISYSLESEEWNVMKDSTKDLAQMVTDEELWKRVKSVMDRRQWEAFYRVYIDGEKTVDVAKSMGVARQSVADMNRRSIGRIKKILGNYEEWK